MRKKLPLYFLVIFILDVLLSLPCDKNLVCDGPSSLFFQYPRLWVLILIPLSLLALSLIDKKHKFWLKFTGIFFAVSMVLVFISPEYDSGIVGFDRELVNWFFAGLYSFVSIIYFIVQYFKKDRDLI